MALDRSKTQQQAEKFVKSGKINDAINAYKKLAEDNPRDLNIFNKLGDLYVRANKTQDAIRYFLRIAELYSKDGFLLKAIAMYKKICKLDPSNMDCVLKLADQYQQQGLTIEAKAQYLQVIDHLVKSSQLQKAVEVFPKILEIEPSNIKVRLSYADILVRTNSKDDAVREFVQVATDLIGKGMRDEAAQVVQQGLKVAPGNGDLTSLMMATGKEGKKDQAELLSSIETMAQANGDNPRSQATLVEAYLSAGKREQAEPIVAKLQQLGDGAPPEVSRAVGRFRLADEDADLAREWLSRAADQFMDGSHPADAAAAMDEFLGKFPDDRQGLAKRADIAGRSDDAEGQTTALHKLVEVLIRLSEIATATEVARRLTTLDPGNPRFTEILAGLEARASGDAPVTAQPQESLESLQLEEEPAVLEGEAAAGADPSGDDEGDDEEEMDDDFVSEHFTEAEVFIKYGLLEKAKQQLLTILAKYPRHVNSHAKLKEIYYEEGNKDKAVEECLTLMELMKAKGSDDDARELINEAIRIDPN
ncbi:MAG: tetratricopeptide repeat protein, partial [Acidobacteriota bacterium]